MSKPSESLLALSSIMDQAATIALRSRAQQQMELKPDGSIVTNADRAVEEFFREELLKKWPGTSVWGEEFGRDPQEPNGYWLIDPIDGTSNFAFGSPLWGISVGLAVDNELKMGAVWLPDLRESYVAETGLGAWCNEQKLLAIPPGAIQPHELVSHNESVPRRYPNQFIPGKMRCAGAFVIDGTFTARQRYRGLIGRGEYLYDAAGSILINQELGADIRWADGNPLDYPSLIGGQRFDRAWIIFPQASGFVLSESS